MNVLRVSIFRIACIYYLDLPIWNSSNPLLFTFLKKFKELTSDADSETLEAEIKLAGIFRDLKIKIERYQLKALELEPKPHCLP